MKDSPGYRESCAHLVAREQANKNTDIQSFLFHLAQPQEGERVLDLCCGAGKQSIPLAMKITPSGHLVGLDQIEDLIAEARSRAESLKHTEFCVHDANRPLPLDDTCFELVVCCYAIYYLEDLPAVLDEVRRVLVPKGRFFVLGPARNNNHEMRELHTRLSGVEEPAAITLYRHRIEDEVVPLCRERWAKVSVVPFHNEVRFTDASAYGKYYRASPLLARATGDDVAREELARRVEAEVAARIAAEGAFVIHKEAVGVLAAS